MEPQYQWYELVGYGLLIGILLYGIFKAIDYTLERATLKAHEREVRRMNEEYNDGGA